MGGFDHRPQAEETCDPRTSSRNARLGMILFALYMLFYAAFVLLNAFRPTTMDVSFAGINLAIWYGLVLIIAAIALSLIYVWACRAPARTGSHTGGRP